MKRDPLLHP